MQQDLTPEQTLARRLLQIKAIRLSPHNPFTWASGIQSPIYCDNRMLLSYPDIRNTVIKQMVAQSDQFEGFDGIAGVATAGIAYGALVADRLNLPMLYVRSKAKGHGRQNQIEGDLSTVKSVLVIEDLISTGGSSLKAVNALIEAGIEVKGVLAIFTYGFDKSRTAFGDAGIPFQTLSNYDVLIEEAVDAKYVTPEDRAQLMEWRQSLSMA